MNLGFTFDEAVQLLGGSLRSVWWARSEPSVIWSAGLVLLLVSIAWIHWRSPRLRLPISIVILVLYIRVFGAWSEYYHYYSGGLLPRSLSWVPGVVLLLPLLCVLGHWSGWAKIGVMLAESEFRMIPPRLTWYSLAASIPLAGAFVRPGGWRYLHDITTVIQDEIAFRGFVFLCALRVWGFWPAVTTSAIASIAANRLIFLNFASDDLWRQWDLHLRDRILQVAWVVASCQLLRRQPRSIWACVLGHIGFLLTYRGTYWNIGDLRGMVTLAASAAAVGLPWLVSRAATHDPPAWSRRAKYILAILLFAGAGVRFVRIEASPYLFSKTFLGLPPDDPPACHKEDIGGAVEAWKGRVAPDQEVEVQTCIELIGGYRGSADDPGSRMTVAIAKLHKQLDKEDRPVEACHLLVADRRDGRMAIRMSSQLTGIGDMRPHGHSIRALRTPFFPQPLIVISYLEEHTSKAWNTMSLWMLRLESAELVEVWADNSCDSGGGGRFSRETMNPKFDNLYFGRSNSFQVEWHGEDWTRGSTYEPGAPASIGEMYQTWTWREQDRKYVMTSKTATGDYGY